MPWLAECVLPISVHLPWNDVRTGRVGGLVGKAGNGAHHEVRSVVT